MNLVVLGMHRSGTSLLVGLLELFGHELGDVSEKTSALKPTGTKENMLLRSINNKILNFNQLSWDFPGVQVDYNQQIQKQIESFIQHLPSAKNWALKDPRMVLTYNIWEKHLPFHSIIATFRHPLLVAKSLKLKNNINEAQAVKIWTSYNQALLNLWKLKKFPILNFDLDPKVYYQKLKQIQTYLTIELDVEKFDEFYHQSSLKSIPKDLSMYPMAMKLYEELLEINIEEYGNER